MSRACRRSIARRSHRLTDLRQIEPRDRWAARFIDAIPSLADALGGCKSYLDTLRAIRSDHAILWRGKRIHLESYGPSNGIQILFHHGYGAYSALYGPFLVLLANEGLNVLAIDRPGHGLSEGNPGDCTVPELAEVSRLVAEQFSSPTTRQLVIFGSSAGGMLTSCLIPYLDDVASGYVCHGVHNPAYAKRWLGPGLAWVADRLPMARFPYGWIPRRFRDRISDVDAIKLWWRPGSDPLAEMNQTFRSVMSMTVANKRGDSLDTCRHPVLVFTGSQDRMLEPEQVQRSLVRMNIPDAEIAMIESGHMLLHENPAAVLDALLPWLRKLPPRQLVS